MNNNDNNSRSNSVARTGGRSRHGCLTCKRRKVRCNEQRPRCSHCERLNLECSWKPNTALALAAAQRRQQQQQQRGQTPTTHTFEVPQTQNTTQANSSAGLQTPRPTRNELVAVAPNNAVSGVSGVLQMQPPVDQVFDYAGFMWDSAEWWQQYQPIDTFYPTDAPFPDIMTSPSSTSSPHMILPIAQPHNTALSTQEMDATPNRRKEDPLLLNYFAHSIVPPILGPVETQQQWSSMRQHFLTMSKESTMVRAAILTFSDLSLRRRENSTNNASSHTIEHYQTTASELARCVDTPPDNFKREHLLATYFFLSYVDILEGRTEAAHKSLKAAYTIFDEGEKTGFRPVEIRILSWIRLLDARAVSAGGEGLFLSDDEATGLLVQPSPASLDSVPPDPSNMSEHDSNAEIEDVLFQALYQPGAVFFQKVQSFMGRISKIDPWHRSRGTVADETEVMNIAAGITRDLDKLFDGRPRLMDYAIKGQLTPQYLSPHLAHTITRAFRTYASNFYASKIHLHRVAYKNLPLALDTVLALTKIKELARLMVETPSESDTGGAEPLPVNMLWPLLMLGSEEEDPQEREWIKNQILRMQSVATNAKMTAQVLEEVQTTQDETRTRVDIRSVMHKIFDACFAIV